MKVQACHLLTRPDFVVLIKQPVENKFQYLAHKGDRPMAVGTQVISLGRFYLDPSRVGSLALPTTVCASGLM